MAAPVPGLRTLSNQDVVAERGQGRRYEKVSELDVGPNEMPRGPDVVQFADFSPAVHNPAVFQGDHGASSMFDDFWPRW